MSPFWKILDSHLTDRDTISYDSTSAAPPPDSAVAETAQSATQRDHITAAAHQNMQVRSARLSTRAVGPESNASPFPAEAVAAGVAIGVIVLVMLTVADHLLRRRRRRRQALLLLTLPSDPESPVCDDQDLGSAFPHSSGRIEAQSNSVRRETNTIISARHSTVATQRQLELQQSSEALLARIASLEAERAASNDQQRGILELIENLRAENERLK
ncbi:hypothetical protein C8J56DRAFT_1165408 [Mycena floridula]|nr:hypothetical protein C8J56DRAFT_1165408 [Mycena floridula]